MYQPQPGTEGAPSALQDRTAAVAGSQRALMTVPALAARMAVCLGTAMSTPLWVGRSAVRNPDTIGPLAGVTQPEAVTWPVCAQVPAELAVAAVLAAPLVIVLTVIAVAVDTTPRAAGWMAMSAATHVLAQVAFGVAFARVLRQRGPLFGISCGALVYLACSLLVQYLPDAFAVVVAVAALALGPQLMPAGQPQRPAPRHWSSTTLTCLSAAVVVAVALLSSRLAGPDVAGAIAAFPTMCTTLTVVAVARDGATAGVHALGGLIRSLPCYLAFCLVVAITTPMLGIAAVGLGLLACLGMATFTWRRVPKATTTGTSHQEPGPRPNAAPVLVAPQAAALRP
jgi:hypothetical protein